MKIQSIWMISNKFKDVGTLPKWLRHGISVFKQIRLIRQAFGMSQKQLAEKIGSDQKNIATLENKQLEDTRISTIKRIAEALNCDLLMTLVPKKKIEEFLEEKSLQAAKQIVAGSSSTMAMELQKPDKDSLKQQIQEIKTEILRKKRHILWQHDEK
jgi:predicted DNA-binding mobile mystery protein A